MRNPPQEAPKKDEKKDAEVDDLLSGFGSGAKIDVGCMKDNEKQDDAESDGDNVDDTFAYVKEKERDEEEHEKQQKERELEDTRKQEEQKKLAEEEAKRKQKEEEDAKKKEEEESKKKEEAKEKKPEDASKSDEKQATPNIFASALAKGNNGQQTCPTCSLQSPSDAIKCTVCETPLKKPEAAPKQDVQSSQEKSDTPNIFAQVLTKSKEGKQQCPECTLDQPVDATKCGVCDYALKKDTEKPEAPSMPTAPPTAPTGSGFSFGGGSFGSSAQKPSGGFSFGASSGDNKKDDTVKAPSTGGFSFGGASFGSSAADKKEEKKDDTVKAPSGFSFGGSSFGAKPATEELKKDETVKAPSGFSFGGASTEAKDDKKEEPKNAFSFAKPAENKAQNAFSFGGFKKPESDSPNTKNAFGFGSGSLPAGNQTSSAFGSPSGFSFGNQPAPSQDLVSLTLCEHLMF